MTTTTRSRTAELIHSHMNQAHNHEQAAAQADDRGAVDLAAHHRAEARMHRNWAERLRGSQA